MTSSQRLVFIVIFLALIAGLHLTSVGQTLGLKGLDLWQHSHQPDTDIVLLAIDSKSISKIGRWPWGRDIHAQVLDKLGPMQPRAVGLDITFASPQEAKQDEVLAKSLEKAPFPVVLAGETVFLNGQPQRFTLPLESLTKSDHVATGITNVPLSADGVGRSVPGPTTIDTVTLDSLSGALAKAVKGPEVSKQPALINFAGPAGTFPTYSVSDFLDNQVPSDALKDKIVLIGATASDLHDTLLVPLKRPVMAGIEWNANVLGNLLIHSQKQTVPPSVSLVISLIIGGLFLAALARVPAQRLTWSLGVVAIVLPVASWIAWQQGYAVAYTGPLLATVSLGTFHGFYRWFVAEQEKRQLRQTVQPYFSKQIIEAILKDPDQLKLGGQEKEVTIFFSDIRSFTTITENLPPAKLIALLHEYFTAMTEEVLATDGVIDKFIGDAIMAFWGAPLDQTDQADRAVKTAIGMMARLKSLQQKWLAEGYPLVDIGIGINTGVVTVGNMGSAKRFDYTVIGDDVNAASRLEGLNKEYKTHIIISESTKKKLKRGVKVKKLGQVNVKGKAKALLIYEVVTKT